MTKHEDEGKLIFTLPQGYRPKYFTGFALHDDPALGGLMIYQNGEVRFFGPEPPAIEVAPLVITTLSERLRQAAIECAQWDTDMNPPLTDWSDLMDEAATQLEERS